MGERGDGGERGWRTPSRRPRRFWLIDPRVVDLLFYKTFADIRAEAAKTYINYLWWVLDPILSMLVFYVVFSLLFERDGEGFVAFLLIGLVAWNWYIHTITHAGNSILAGIGLMNQVHVPKLVFPLVTMMTDLSKFLVVFAVLLIFLWFSGYGVGIAYLALIPLLLVQLLLAWSLGILLAAAVPYLPDLRLLVENLLHLQFFLSGVFFSVKELPEAYQSWFYLNPMASLIEDYRRILLEQSWPHWPRLAAIAGFALIVMALAVVVTRRHERDYPRVVM
jgi:lipopolysaccharide transport system permease protein